MYSSFLGSQTCHGGQNATQPCDAISGGDPCVVCAYCDVAPVVGDELGYYPVSAQRVAVVLRVSVLECGNKWQQQLTGRTLSRARQPGDRSMRKLDSCAVAVLLNRSRMGKTLRWSSLRHEDRPPGLHAGTGRPGLRATFRALQILRVGTEHGCWLSDPRGRSAWTQSVQPRH